MKPMYIKLWVKDEIGVRQKQKVITPISIDKHGNVTAKFYNDNTKEYEVMVFRTDQVSESPYLMDFD
jgi:hypothetical protein